MPSVQRLNHIMSASTNAAELSNLYMLNLYILLHMNKDHFDIDFQES